MIELGTHQLPSTVFLAPMAGVSDRVFRSECIRQGAGLAASEMISSDTTLYATEKTRHRIERADGGLPHAVQIAGADPAAMAEAAAINVAAGADVIDINMGCPAKKVCRQAAGSALLEHPDRVRAILRAIVRRVDVPVTLKIRTGPAPDWRNGVEIARIAESEGIVCLAVHGRTRSDRFAGDAEYDTIASIVEAVSIPVVANGDIDSAAKALTVLRHTGAAGVMIGRAAQGYPWIFREIVAALAGRQAPESPGTEDVHRAIRRQIVGCHDLYGSRRGVRVARKHIAWYCRGIRDCAAFRAAINSVDDPAQQLDQVDEFFSTAVSCSTGPTPERHPGEPSLALAALAA